VVDVENDPGGLERMHALGARTLPCVAKGDQFIIAKNLKAVAEFVGASGPSYVLLAPDILFEKWNNILRAGERYVRQFPPGELNRSATPGRMRPIRLLCHHVFRIGDGFLQSVIHGVQDMDSVIRGKPADDTFTTREEIARYGEQVTAALEQWWKGIPDKSCQRKIEITHYGVLTLNQLMERSTWHTAHHVRQLVDVLERLGIPPDGGFNRRDLEGLPLPKRIWD
jgi:hypothetical protein